MSVTVKFAERMKPPSAVNPQPQISEVPDAVIEAGTNINVVDGWLCVGDDSGILISAYCPGSVLRAYVDDAEVAAVVGPTDEDPSGSAAMDAANAAAAAPSSDSALVGADGAPLSSASDAPAGE
jgi:hypothetical protein